MVSQTVMLVEPRQRSKREGIPDYDRGEETMLGTTVNGWCGRQRAFRYGHIEDARVWADTMLCCFATSEAELRRGTLRRLPQTKVVELLNN